MEKKAVNDMFVILSDIWLDNEEVICGFFILFCFETFGNILLNLNNLLLVEKTMEKLKNVLDVYENVEVVPSLFVFMGNFCSHPCNLSFHSFSTLR